jgi:hypothetical protein
MQVLDVAIADDGGDDDEGALPPVQAHRVSIQEDSLSVPSTSMGNSSGGGVLAMGEVVSIVAPIHEESEDDNQEFYKREVMGGNHSSSEDNRRLSSGSTRNSSAYRSLSIPVEPSGQSVSILTEFTSMINTPQGDTPAANVADPVAHPDDEGPNPDPERKPADVNRPLVSMRWSILAGGVLLVVGGLLGGFCGTKKCRSPRFAPSASPTLNLIQQRKKLLCGILDGDEARKEFNTHLVRFSIQRTIECTCGLLRYSHLTREMLHLLCQCKSLAAAIFGRAANRFKTVPVHASTRFGTLNDEVVDILVSTTTHTMERELHEVSREV